MTDKQVVLTLNLMAFSLWLAKKKRQKKVVDALEVNLG
jgi:hypothetical protein